LPVVTLPNGLTVESPSEKEALFLYNVFFGSDNQAHGFELEDGACVFDIGANVGLFSASLVQKHRNLRLVLFEPIPDTFAMLERNAADGMLGDAVVSLVKAGVSSAPGTAAFEFETGSSISAAASTFLRQVEQSSRSARRRAGSAAWARAAVADGERAGLIPARTARRVNAALDSRVLRLPALALVWAFSALARLARRRTHQEVVCEMTTVSAVMRQLGIERVDLLKVDAEGAEWEVLQGIEDQDWPRIRQLTVEVHVSELVDRIRSLLEEKRYEVVVEHERWQLPDLLGFRTVYARR
jgi:FkbM family methyltransferase